ncbi:DNA-binding transcriptional regulator, MarR family [Geodermatophilus saharensis]|uniref:DNA-binding transcriptional regulator, MarR family n=1 Tax=Geodermatophilus saharensis TaxID=1137994 RepID=A0A239BY43_9ACTN|nr:MarR family transcriptional regulator [Geodermatophilus saharensis]SNS12073.1 DNA-binding transcriptional regulator, MarR family [Geodermatophilus saharensis]
MTVEQRATGVPVPPSTGPSLVELLTAVTRRVARGVTAVLAEDGATLDSYRVLRALGAGPGCTMGELGGALTMPAPTATRLVDGLVDAALAYRLPDPDDGRRVRVHLSARGRTRLDRLEALVRAHEDALAAELGAERVGALVAALTDVAAARV